MKLFSLGIFVGLWVLPIATLIDRNNLLKFINWIELIRIEWLLR